MVGEEEDMCGAVVAMARQFTHVPPGVVPTDVISPSYGVNVCLWHSTILIIVLTDLFLVCRVNALVNIQSIFSCQLFLFQVCIIILFSFKYVYNYTFLFQVCIIILRGVWKAIGNCINVLCIPLFIHAE